MNDDRRDSDKVEGFSTAADAVGSLMRSLFSQVEDGAEGTGARDSPKETKTTRRAAGKLEKSAAEIAARPDKTEAAYLARELVQCTLPHRDPGDVAVWIRRNGNYALGLQPGVDLKTGKSYGLPSGSIPRLLLFWIVTEACRMKKKGVTDRRIKLGETLSDFLREVGLNPNTGRGKRGDAKRLKEQMLRLFRCRISFEYNEAMGRQSWLDMQVAPKAEMWWDYKNPDQASFFESHIVLGDEFFNAITAAPVPVDFRALKALKQSPFALDLYAWATYRIFKMQEAKRREVSISMKALQEQFGAEYGRARDFKAALTDALDKVQRVFPALDYSIEKDRFILRDATGRPAIARRGQRNTKALGMGEAMSQEVSQKVRDRFTKRYQLHNVEDALAAFYTWRDGSEIKSDNADAHFWDFVKNHYFKR